MSNYNTLVDYDGLCYCFPLPVSIIKGYFLRTSDVYFLRYNIRYGSLSWRVVYGSLNDMLRKLQLTFLSYRLIKGDGSVVFFWRAVQWQCVMEQLRFFAKMSVSSASAPLADFEFVHPYSATIICSQGVYSNEKFVDTYRHEMGRCVVDLKQSLMEVK